ncbi:hypothetical protein [Catenulispora pinisilvae]|uniref:hypothetical protein n=1 Tax=Catenulispora pinisilvae TaxID=2705253 RepID=UPI0018915307|nr:hypothetical protein [Catenulispora pinisilvae]
MQLRRVGHVGRHGQSAVEFRAERGQPVRPAGGQHRPRATIEQIAARAGVSRPAVFGVGNKAQLFALACQRATAGGRLTANDEGFQRLLAIPDAHRLLVEFAAFTAAISQRLGPLRLILEQVAGPTPNWRDYWNQASRNCWLAPEAS